MAGRDGTRGRTVYGQRERGSSEIRCEYNACARRWCFAVQIESIPRLHKRQDGLDIHTEKMRQGQILKTRRGKHVGNVQSGWVDRKLGC